MFQWSFAQKLQKSSLDSAPTWVCVSE